MKLGDVGISQWVFNSNGTQWYPQGRAICYLAPEVLKRDGFSTKVDVWALGVIILEMLNQRPPFTDQESVLNQPPPEARDGTSPELKQVIKKMLEKNPDSRPTIEEILEMAPFKKQPPPNLPQNQAPQPKFDENLHLPEQQHDPEPDLSDYAIVQPLDLSSGSLGPAPLVATSKSEKVAKGNLPHFYVLKLIPLSRFGIGKQIRLFYAQKELQRLADHNHPSMVNVYNFFLQGAFLHVVSDFVVGDNLSKVIGKMAQMKSLFPETHIIRWLGQIAQVMMHFHKLQPPVLHGHLRPEVIFVSIFLFLCFY